MIATGASPSRQAIVDFHPVVSQKRNSPASHRRRSGRSMPQKIRIALDAMGGDHGPSVVVPGAAVALQQHPDASFILFGDQAKIEPLLAAHPQPKASCRLGHTGVAARMEDKPSQALRNGRWKSSMWLAIDAVKK